MKPYIILRENGKLDLNEREKQQPNNFRHGQHFLLSFSFSLLILSKVLIRDSQRKRPGLIAPSTKCEKLLAHLK